MVFRYDFLNTLTFPLFPISYSLFPIPYSLFPIPSKSTIYQNDDRAVDMLKELCETQRDRNLAIEWR